MRKSFLTLLGLILFAPAGALWLAAELIYLVAFALKLGCSIIATVMFAISALVDKGMREAVFGAGVVFTTKYLIEQEISDQCKALRLSSGLFWSKE